MQTYANCCMTYFLSLWASDHWSPLLSLQVIQQLWLFLSSYYHFSRYFTNVSFQAMPFSMPENGQPNSKKCLQYPGVIDPSLVASALNTPTLASVPVLSPNFVCALVSVASPHQHTKHVRLRDSAKWGPWGREVLLVLVHLVIRKGLGLLSHGLNASPSEWGGQRRKDQQRPDKLAKAVAPHASQQGWTRPHGLASCWPGDPTSLSAWPDPLNPSLTYRGYF